jgi:hypothetical protein
MASAPVTTIDYPLSDHAQDKPETKNHATAAMAFENKELYAEPNVARIMEFLATGKTNLN